MTEEDRYYREIYLGEVRDHISRLNELFLHLEKSPEDRDALNEAFRVMHTIKGDSAMMGLSHIAEKAHKAEDILDGLRGGRERVCQEVIDRLLSHVDDISELVEEFAGRASGKFGIVNANHADEAPAIKHETGCQASKMKELEDAILKMDASISKAVGELEIEGKQPPLSPDPGSCGETGAPKGKEAIPKGFRLTIKTEMEKVLRPVRAFMLLKILVENGELIRTDPPNEPLANGEFEDSIVAEVVTKDLGAMLDAIKAVPGVIDVFVEECEPPEQEEKISLADKTSQIDRLVSCVEAQGKEVETATISVDSTKGRHKVEEIKVNIASLDRLFNLSGELVLAKSRLGNIVKQHESPEMKEVHRFIEGVVSDLQTEVMNLRLMPIGQVFGIFPRMVRDMSKAVGKEIDLIIEGGDTAVDRKILEEIVDPVVHIVRNCVDHGIETPEERVKKGKGAVGTIRISASRDASHFILEVEDDGRGIDPSAVKQTAIAKGLISPKKAEGMSDEEALYLTCVPGFSTKKSVSELSGRGMGMSAVKNKIEAFGGSLSISSKVEQGTKITIRLPASMATVKVIVVGVGGQVYAIPVADVLEIVEIRKEDIKFIQGAPFINLRGDVIRLYRLAWLLGVQEGICNSYPAVIIRRGDGKNYGLLVTEVRDEDEVAMKPVPRILRGVKGFLGSAILGDGKPTFVIDVMSIV
ncbi:MAG: chemotaxis protein CheA [Candidatus Verstraetearchaeota archaeon]|nr:chemotaxis protein CheA [Candidatus Verstraetearchaeota archaeon]